MTRPALRDRACPLCGSHDARAEVASAPRAEACSLRDLHAYWYGIDRERRFFTYHRCTGCGQLYNRAFFDAEQLASLYSAMLPNMAAVPESAVRATQRGYYDDVAASVVAGGAYLEIGPDVGHLVREAARRGRFRHFWLFEPNRAVHPALKRAAGAVPTTIADGMTDLSAVPDRSVSLAAMVHVLDHLLDPAAMLRAVRAKLRQGGVLMIVTHNEGSAMRRLLGRRWPVFCLQHPQLYNPRTIRRQLERSGFGAIEVRRSRNVFPVDFLARQALQAAGWPGARVPLPRWPVGLRLGNMLTLASAD